MQDKLTHLRSELHRAFSTTQLSVDIQNDEVTATLGTQGIVNILKQLSAAPEFKFEQLIDLSCVDYLAFGKDEWNSKPNAYSNKVYCKECYDNKYFPFSKSEET